MWRGARELTPYGTERVWRGAWLGSPLFALAVSLAVDVRYEVGAAIYGQLTVINGEHLLLPYMSGTSGDEPFANAMLLLLACVQILRLEVVDELCVQSIQLQPL